MLGSPVNLEFNFIKSPLEYFLDEIGNNDAFII